MDRYRLRTLMKPLALGVNALDPTYLEDFDLGHYIETRRLSGFQASNYKFKEHRIYGDLPDNIAIFNFYIDQIHQCLLENIRIPKIVKQPEPRAVLDYARVTYSGFLNCDLESSELDCEFYKVVFRSCNLINSRFKGRIETVIFEDCNLNGMQLNIATDYSGQIEWTNSNLENIKLATYTNQKYSLPMHNISFKDCNLEGADLSELNVRFGDLQLSNVWYSNTTRWPKNLTHDEIASLLKGSVNMDEVRAEDSKQNAERQLIIVAEQNSLALLREQAIDELCILSPTLEPDQFSERAIQAMMQKLERTQLESSEQKLFARFQVQAWMVQLNLLKELIEASKVAGAQREQLIMRIAYLETSILQDDNTIISKLITQLELLEALVENSGIAEQQRKKMLSQTKELIRLIQVENSNKLVESSTVANRYKEEYLAQNILQRRQNFFQLFNSRIGQQISITQIGYSGGTSGIVQQVGSEAVLVNGSWISYDQIDHAE